MHSRFFSRRKNTKHNKSLHIEQCNMFSCMYELYERMPDHEKRTRKQNEYIHRNTYTHAQKCINTYTYK